jgi:lipopolysaccharide transport system ATP-binding protein
VSKPPIVVEEVSKRYRLGVTHDRNLTTRLESMIRAPYGRLRGRKPPPRAASAEDFWALRDVSLEVEQGEVLGLVGANGAGKSTLLKLMARITPPTSGRITMRGRVGSLLEVGTGFHPELTGRENVFLNGSILGMRRREIAARYAEIAEFSGIEGFLETPVKRYSSGMFVRLAFSVAAHLEPEILIVDEVLAVGDAEFQKRSLGKMEEVSGKDGRTIVFVSHNMASIRRLCDRAVLIEGGQVRENGPPDQVITDYLERVEPIQHGGRAVLTDRASRIGNGDARITIASLVGEGDELLSQIKLGQPFGVVATVEVERPVENAVLEIGVSTPDGVRVMTALNTDSGAAPFKLDAGTWELRADVATQLLPGEYVVDLGLATADGVSVDTVDRAVAVKVLNSPWNEGDSPYPWHTVRGSVRPECRWAQPVREDAANSLGAAR